MSQEGQTGDPFAGLPDLASGLDPEAGHDYIRCCECAYLDRSDFWGIRLKASGMRIGCAKCGGQRFKDAIRISRAEIKRIRSGWYETYQEHSED